MSLTLRFFKVLESDKYVKGLPTFSVMVYIAVVLVPENNKAIKTKKSNYVTGSLFL
jgi:hypothetical protein